ncbi:MAG: LpqB family beta-propeller domain-containing protein [Streptosporangiales bacterium]
MSKKVVCALAVLVALLLAGCARMPTSGPIQAGRGEATGDRKQPVQVFAQRPRDGWSPGQIVTGFLAAMANPDQGHEVAGSYLTPNIRSRWPSEDNPAVVVYEHDENFRLEIGRQDTVSVTATKTATISQRGQYRPAPQGATTHAVFRLQQVNHEWRIGSLPGHLMLSENDAVSAYEPFDLYYFSKDGRRLVPDSIVLPWAESDDWPNELIEQLFAGPTSAFAGAVTSAIPRRTRLEAAPTLDEKGVATVRLGGAASAVSGEARDKMVAQIVATLLQVQGVSRVRVQTSDKGTSESYGPEAHKRYDAGMAATNVRGYFIRQGKLFSVSTTTGTVEPLRGPFGVGDVAFRDPAISLDGRKAAGLSPDGDTLYVAPVDRKGPLVALYKGTRLSSPSWDRSGDLWVVENTSSGPRLLVFENGADKPQEVPAPGLHGLEVGAVRVAWGGVRMAIAATGGNHGQLLMGTIVRGRAGEDGDAAPQRLDEVRGVAPTLTDVGDVWWYDQQNLAVLGREQSDLRAAYIVASDGLSINVAPSISDLRSAAAAPGKPLLVADQAGSMWLSQPDEFNTTPLGHGHDPAYPG